MKKRSIIVPSPVMTKSSPEHVQAVQQLRRSGAAGAHDARAHRHRTRAAIKNAAIQQSSAGND